MDHTYLTPYYDPSVDDDGNLLNPGAILFHKENYSGNKDSFGLSTGFALTFSIPLDKRFQTACLESATVEGKIRHQILANKRLDFEIARLRECGNLAISGIEFHPDSPYHSVCADIVVNPKKGQILPHLHELKTD